MRTLRVGGVPEHLNIPWWVTQEEGGFDDVGVAVEWVSCPGGTGEMRAGLDDGSLDVALMLTEGAVAHAARGGASRIIGTYITTPLAWGVHVGAASDHHEPDDLRGGVFGISREGSGSHLMAYVYAGQRGWGEAGRPSLKIVGGLDGAREAFEAGTIDGFLWERFMTKPLVDAGAWRRVGICKAPWSAFVVVARPEIADACGAELCAILASVATRCAALASDEPRLIAEVVRRFEHAPEDARDWAAQITWSCETVVDADELARTAAALVEVGALDTTPALDDLIAPDICTTRPCGC